jgi:hypothetical protein
MHHMQRFRGSASKSVHYCSPVVTSRLSLLDVLQLSGSLAGDVKESQNDSSAALTCGRPKTEKTEKLWCHAIDKGYNRVAELGDTQLSKFPVFSGELHDNCREQVWLLKKSLLLKIHSESVTRNVYPQCDHRL